MDLIERTNVFIATLLRVISDGTVNRWADDGLAQVSRFWSTDPTVSSGIALAQLIAAMLSAIFVFILVVAFLRRRQLMQASVATDVGQESGVPFPTGPLRERWNEVVGHLESPQEAEWKLAVLEADKVVDD